MDASSTEGPDPVRLLEAAEDCAARGQRDAALVLAYALLERMAWIHRASGHPEAMRSDLVAWAGAHLLPGANLGCTAMELYAARCEALHGGPPRMVREGRVRRLRHVWDEDPTAPDTLSVPRLLRALHQAVQMWNSRMSSSSST